MEHYNTIVVSVGLWFAYSTKAEKNNKNFPEKAFLYSAKNEKKVM